MKSCEKYELLISAFLDGELSEAERADVAEHLADCPGCQRYFDDLVAMHDAFGQEEEVPVPEGFAEGIMARVRETPQRGEKKVLPFPHWKRWAALAACCAFAALGLWTFSGRGTRTASQTVLARGGPALSGGAAAEDSTVPEEEYEPALMMDEGLEVCSEVSDATPEEKSASTEAENTTRAKEDFADGIWMDDTGLPQASPALAAPPAPDAAAEKQASPSGIITADSPAAQAWVEETLGLEWEDGRTYLLTEEEFAGLTEALTAAGEAFRLEEGEGCWLLAGEPEK